MKKSIYKCLIFFIVVMMAIAVFGCDAEVDPVVDYENKLDDININERFDDFTGEINEISALLMQDLEDTNADAMENTKTKTNELINDVESLKNEVENLDISDEKVVNANYYLADYLRNIGEALKRYDQMLDAMVEFKDLEDDLDAGNIPENFEEIIDEVTEKINTAENEALVYFEIAGENLADWSEALE